MTQIEPNMMFGYWKVLRQSEESKSYYVCLCTGCNKTTKSIRKWNLLKNLSKSCGCMKIETMKETNRDKYGVDFSQQNSEIKLKSVETLIEKYGVDNYAKTEEFKEKCKETNLENWGSDHHTKSEKWKNKDKPKYGGMLLGKAVLGRKPFIDEKEEPKS